MPVEQPRMVRVIDGLARNLTGRERAIHDRAGCRPQRVQVHTIERRSTCVEGRERLAVDVDGDLVGRGCDAHLGDGGGSAGEQVSSSVVEPEPGRNGRHKGLHVDLRGLHGTGRTVRAHPRSVENDHRWSTTLPR